MGLSITRGNRGEIIGPPVKADRRLMLTADQKTVVEADDERAAYLLVAEGGEISRARAVELGLGLGRDSKVLLQGGTLDLEVLNGIVADRRIAVKKDEVTICEPTDPGAAKLLVAEGDVIPANVCALLRLELVGGRVRQRAEGEVKSDPKPPVAPPDPAGTKQQEKPEDKSLKTKVEDKSGGKKRGQAPTPKEAKKKGKK